MFNVDFYSFTKKENSTKRPTTPTVTYTCIFKEPSSIINPTLALDLGLNENPSHLNYCYISTFGRYYFINEWTFNNSLWYANCSVDVLASGKDYIGNEDLYVIRSSAQSDGYIVDNKYPITNRVNSWIDNAPLSVAAANGPVSRTIENYWNRSVSAGYFYLGVVGNSLTGLTWYVMPANTFSQLINDLMGFAPSDWGDIPEGMAKQMANPIQYISKCYWLPDLPLVYAPFSPTRIRLGTYDFTLSSECYVIDPVAAIQTYATSINLRKHPQAATRGNYLNNSPYSTYQLAVPGFGNIELDASLMIDDASVDLYWSVDYTTGEADMYVRATNSLLGHMTSKLGVPIQLTQVTTSLLGQATGLAANMFGGTIGTLMGKGAEILFDAAGISNAHSQPKISSVGGGGNFLPFNQYPPRIYSDFRYIVDEYNQELGRPYCKIAKPANLGGYVQVMDGSLDAPYTKNELNQINSYLQGGFFYE